MPSSIRTEAWLYRRGSDLSRCACTPKSGACDACVVLNGCEGKSERSFFKCSTGLNQYIIEGQC